MTVSKDYNKRVYEGNGLTTSFPFDFELPYSGGEPDVSTIRVFLTDAVGDVTELTSGFTIDAGNGTVTYPTTGDPLPEGRKITILRDLPTSQQFMSVSNQANLYPKTLEDAVDRLVMMVQQVRDTAKRAIRLPVDIVDPTDAEVNPIPILNARTEAVGASVSAQASQAAAALSESQAQTAKNTAVTANNNAQDAAGRADTSALEAAASAILAHGYAAPAWNGATEYNYPELVAYTDGHTYRCLGTAVVGEIPPGSALWQRVTVTRGDYFEVDEEGDYMISAAPLYSDKFELDEQGDVMPLP